MEAISGALGSVDRINRNVEELKRDISEVGSKIEYRPKLPVCGERALRAGSKKRVLLIGYFGDKNYGDELMLKILWSNLKRQKDIDVSIILVDTLDYNLAQWKGARLYAPPVTHQNIANIAKSYDEVILGGGAHIDDNPLEFFSYIPYLALELSLESIKAGKSVKWIGVSSSAKIENKNYAKKLQAVIDGSTHFSLRDTQSKKTLEDAGINTKKIVIANDIAFAAKLNIKTIGVTLINSFADEDYLVNFLNDIKGYIQKSGEAFQIALLPFYNNDHSDHKLYSSLISKVRWGDVPVFIAPEYDNTESMLLALKSCDILVNMRYHASLLGLNSGIPTISVCYDNHPHYYNKVTYLHETFKDRNVIYFSKYNSGDIAKLLANLEVPEYQTSKISEASQQYLDKVLK